MTFSVVARCARTGQLGVAIATAIPGVGALCCAARARTGVVATQAWVNPYLGGDGLDLLGSGVAAEDAVQTLVAADPGRDDRQLLVADAAGGAAAWTGTSCTGWAGHRTGASFAVAGNMLTGPEPVARMTEAMGVEGVEPLAERLLAALEAGQAAGGDRRGRQSAALLVVDREAYPAVDLRVDEHHEPVGELRRVWEVARRQLLPFVATLPTRADPHGHPDPAVTEMVLRPPHLRPGGRG